MNRSSDGGTHGLGGGAVGYQNLIAPALKAIAPALGGRPATWRQLLRDAPRAVVTEVLGVPATAMRHANLAGADFLRYASPDRSRPPID
jgi:hypothetical protein